MKRKRIIAALAASVCIFVSGCSSPTLTAASEPTSATTTAEQTAAKTTAEHTTAETTAKQTTAETTAKQTTAETTAKQTTAETTAKQTTAETTAKQTTAETTAKQTTAETTAKQTTAETTAEQTTAKTTAETTAPKTEKEQETTTMEAPAETEKKYIALTFDDGPNTTTTADVLDVLGEYGVTASFFVVGQNINSSTGAVMKRSHDMGCEINSHSYTHSYMDKMEAEDMREEMEKTAELIHDYTGEYPKFFRPPYIAVNSTLYENVDIPFICGIGCNDWNQKIPAAKRVQVIERSCDDGDIILLHDSAGNDQTVEALKEIIPFYLEQGYEFVTVTELFKAKGITPSADTEIMYSSATETGF
ncbi:MAG: polysaccharide deacetylase family protein [Ruminiclostridium sp.]